jgi:hypothetical protein
MSFHTFKRASPPSIPAHLLEAFGPNPFAQPSTTRRIDKVREVADTIALGKQIAKLDEYDAVVSGQGPPKLAPFPLDHDGEYHFEIRCSVRSAVVCTSDMHEEVVKDRALIWFGDDCGSEESVGLYAHPESLKLIKVPGAGCARFWVAFELGKFLFPKIQGGDLNVLNSTIVDVAADIFRTPLVQGCKWSL